MPKNTNKHRANKFALPIAGQVKKSLERLPVDQTALTSSVTFSFALLDRNHKLFNLGGNNADGTVGGKWFLDLLDCLKSVSGKTIQELKQRPFCLHPVNWRTTNTKCPFSHNEEWWQFRINKSRGRIIGLLIGGIFYIVWLDPFHNLTSIEGYGGIKTFNQPLSEYEESNRNFH